MTKHQEHASRAKHAEATPVEGDYPTHTHPRVSAFGALGRISQFRYGGPGYSDFLIFVPEWDGKPTRVRKRIPRCGWGSLQLAPASLKAFGDLEIGEEFQQDSFEYRKTSRRTAEITLPKTLAKRYSFGGWEPIETGPKAP